MSEERAPIRVRAPDRLRQRIVAAPLIATSIAIAAGLIAGGTATLYVAAPELAMTGLSPDQILLIVRQWAEAPPGFVAPTDTLRDVWFNNKGTEFDEGPKLGLISALRQSCDCDLDLQPSSFTNETTVQNLIDDVEGE